jgi:DNA invertase Pin-like site-specific DNA recombinase
MLIGYVRVSKNDGSQTLDLQRDALIGAGIQEERIYHDKASGKKEERPGLQDCLKALQPGNTLVVWKLDRLGREMLTHLTPVIKNGTMRKWLRQHILKPYVNFVKSFQMTFCA